MTNKTKKDSIFSMLSAFSTISLLLLAITTTILKPVSATEQADPDMTTIVVNGFPIERIVSPGSPIRVQMDENMPIISATVVDHEHVRCFFWHRQFWRLTSTPDSDSEIPPTLAGYSTLPNGDLTRSRTSPLFSKADGGLDVNSLPPGEKAGFRYLFCYQVEAPQRTPGLLLEFLKPAADAAGGEDAADLFLLTSQLDGSDELRSDVGQYVGRELLGATMLETPIDGLVCTVSGADGREVEVRYGSPHEGNLPGAEAVHCRVPTDAD